MGTKTDDLIVVSRDGVNYKATGSQLFDFDGVAAFDGKVTSGTADATVIIGENDPGTDQARGKIDINVPAGAAGGGAVFAVNKNSSQTIRFNSDGSAEFAAGGCTVSQDGDATFGSASFDGSVEAVSYRIDQLDPITADSP